MKYVIWNITKDKFWSESQNDFSNRYYASKYTLEELESISNKFIGYEDKIIAVIAISI